MKNLKTIIFEALVRPSGWTREKSKKRTVTNSYRIGDKYDSHGGMYQQDDIYNDSDYEGYILDKENNKYKVYGYSKQGDAGAIVGGSTSYRVIIKNDEGFEVVFTGYSAIFSNGSNTGLIGAIENGYYLEDYLNKFTGGSFSDPAKVDELKANGSADAMSYVGHKDEIKKLKKAKFVERYIQLPSRLQLISDGSALRINNLYYSINQETKNIIDSALQQMFKETIEGTFNMSFNELGSFYGDILFKKTNIYGIGVYFDTLKKNVVYVKKDKIEKTPVEMELASTCAFDITKVSPEFMKIIKEYYKYFRKKLKEDKSTWIENKTNSLWKDYVYSYSSKKYSKSQAKKDATEEYRKIEFSYNISRDDFNDKIVLVDIPSLSEISKRVNPNFQNTAEKPDISLNDAKDITLVEEPKDLPKKEKKFKKEQVFAKMTAWHNGERKQNVKNLSDEKLKVKIEACKELGYDKELQILQDEAKSRGLKLESISCFINSMLCFENISSLKESILKSVKAGMHSIDPKTIKTYDAAFEYAKFLYGDKVREEKSGLSSGTGKQFIITFNKKLSMHVDCYNMSTHFFYIFFDGDKDMIWESDTLETNEVDWEVLLKPEKWCKEKTQIYTKLVKKYEKKAIKYYSDWDKRYEANKKIERYKRTLATIEYIKKESSHL